MNISHVHAELIHAWADGAEIQCKTELGFWIDVPHPNWRKDLEYRIKPSKWQKEIDAQLNGQLIQGRPIGTNEWTNSCAWGFDSLAMEYRIKPKICLFRNYQYKDENGITNVGASVIKLTEEEDNFIKWVGDWQETEVL